MPYKFGVAATDNVLFSGQVSTTLQLAGRVIIQMGWFYPTTLTAGRYLMASAGTHGIKIDTTTANLRIVADYATTDGEYTAPANLAVNDWHFIAWASAWGSTTVNAQRLWVGNGVKGIPTERTITQAVAPAGALTGGGTSWRLGNDNAATANAFQGLISGCQLLVENNTTEVSVFGFPGDGALDQARADMLFRRVIDPFWRNDMASLVGMGRQLVRFQGSGPQQGVSIGCSLDNGGAGGGAWYWGGVGSGWQPPTRATITGATSDNTTAQPPRQWDDTPIPTIGRRGGVRRGYMPRVIPL